MRIGLVCPYAWDAPGGVQVHVHDLARSLLDLGHHVNVLAPADDEDALPPYVASGGRPVPVPYNGSVARLTFGPRSAAVTRRWLRDNEFDLIHLHEPLSPSLSLLALWSARLPVVATFHASVDRSRALQTFEPALRPTLEKIHARIAVSSAARRYVVEHVGGSAVLIPNGVAVSRFADAPPLDDVGDEVIGFLGRFDEPRKGLEFLIEAFGILAADRPGVTLLLAGRGDADEARAALPDALHSRVRSLGQISDADKARFYRSVTVFCAPNTHGESFGIVLLEAMAAGAPIVASDIDAFRRVLDDGGSGVLVPPEEPAALAAALGALLDDPDRRRLLATNGRRVVRAYDWPVVTASVVAVYEMVVGATVPVP